MLHAESERAWYLIACASHMPVQSGTGSTNSDVQSLRAMSLWVENIVLGLPTDFLPAKCHNAVQDGYDITACHSFSVVDDQL